jgi:hypothetical protein
MSAAARLVRMHAGLLIRCAERRATERRLRPTDPDRADMAADEADELLANANALRDVLATLPDVHVPDPRQMSLLSDGGR